MTAVTIKPRTRMRARLVLAAVSTCGLAALGWASFVMPSTHVVYNPSNSVPVGWYRIEPVNSPADSLSGLKHCWEYFCRDMVPPEACEECIVHRARIEKCYEVAKLGQTIGHSRTFCRTTCEECSFFRACHGLAPIILVVTTDKALSGRLTGQADSRNVVLRFARSGYESSMLVETFHPSVVVLDSALGEVRDGRLVDSIVHDERIAGVRIIIALRNRDRVAPRQGVSVMSAPFTLEKIERERGKP